MARIPMHLVMPGKSSHVIRSNEDLNRTMQLQGQYGGLHRQIQKAQDGGRKYGSLNNQQRSAIQELNKMGMSAPMGSTGRNVSSRMARAGSASGDALKNIRTAAENVVGPSLTKPIPNTPLGLPAPTNMSNPQNLSKAVSNYAYGGNSSNLAQAVSQYAYGNGSNKGNFLNNARQKMAGAYDWTTNKLGWSDTAKVGPDYSNVNLSFGGAWNAVKETGKYAWRAENGRDRTRKLATLGGAYAGANLIGRELSGGGPTYNNDGQRDIAGIPFF